MKYIFIFIAISINLASAQNINNTIPPSPDVAQFQKYLDYPIDKSTGIPQISVPIYEVVSGSLRVPISLSYHSSGFKVGDQSGVIGLGWSLNAGGMISRTMKHYPDELSKFPLSFKTEINIPESNSGFSFDDFNYLRSISYDDRHVYSPTAFDTDYDIFYFNAGSKSGKFILANKGNGKRTPIIATSQNHIRVRSNAPDFDTALSYFQIIDDNGMLYNYGRSLIDGSSAIETVQNLPSVLRYTSAWFLREIISADRTDTIRFKYQPASKSNIHREDNLILVSDMVKNPGAALPSDGIIETNTMIPHTQNFYESQEIKEIDFKSGKVVFNYTSVSTSQAVVDKLTSIGIYSNDGTLFRSFSFSQLPFANMPSNQNYWKLAEVTSYDSHQNFIDKYSFSYNESYSFDNVSKTSDLSLTSGRDYWGYFNGKVSNVDILPSLSINVQTEAQKTVPMITSGSDRKTYPAAAQTFVLNKVSYPTGGATKFYYEPNQATNTTDQYVGGLRVSKIQFLNSNADVVLTKIYKYGENENGRGTLQLTNGFSDFVKSSNMWQYKNTSQPSSFTVAGRINIVSSSFINGFEECIEAPVLYSVVNEYEIDNDNRSKGKTTYNYELPVINVGSNYNEGQMFTRNYVFYKTPLLLKKEVMNDVNNHYSTVLKDEYHYDEMFDTSISGMRASVGVYGLDELSALGLWHLTVSSGDNPVPIPAEDVFDYYQYEYYIGVSRLSSVRQIEYKDSDSLVSGTSYRYGSNIDIPISESTFNSKGQPKTVYYKYPSDFSSSVYQSMISNNIVSPVIEKRDSTSSKLIRITRTNYYNASANIIVPQSMQIQNASGSLYTAVSFNRYDIYGNLVEEQSSGGKTVYLWGYRGQYPVAKVLGSDYNTVKSLINQAILDNPVSDAVLQTELNKVRSGLKNSIAQVFTYTYFPLIGMTSETDPKGDIIYYEYDGFGRLKDAIDKKGHFVKRYDYHYME